MPIALRVIGSDELRSLWLRKLSFGPQFVRNLHSIQDAILMLAYSHHIRLPARPERHSYSEGCITCFGVYRYLSGGTSYNRTGPDKFPSTAPFTHD